MFNSVSLREVFTGVRFSYHLLPLFRHPIKGREARTILRERIENRARSFLLNAHKHIYSNSKSPYRKLLAMAGCEFGDLEGMVRREGLEESLRTLLRNGVYLTVDEFKGRTAVIRGSSKFTFEARQFWNQHASAHFSVRTSGSGGARMTVPVGLGFVRDCAVNTRLVLEALGGLGWCFAHWGVPGGVAIARILEYAAFGSSIERWFSPVDPRAAGLHPAYFWSARIVSHASRLAGLPIPLPEHALPTDPSPVADWISRVLRTGQVPYVFCYASSALSLCHHAWEHGIDIAGARLHVGGEPITPARTNLMRRAGVVPMPRYGTAESGRIGYGCMEPQAPDDVHFYDDLFAVVQSGPAGDASGDALLLTSLRTSSPLVLLNVSTGDRATVLQRSCGCPLEAVGWTTHLHTIRSFEKLTAAGASLLDTDAIRVLEEVLPERFGGIPTDYQLVEEEEADGQFRLKLLVHPSVQAVAEKLVAETFVAEITKGSGIEKMTGILWRDANLIAVERGIPRATAAGKILHLHRCGNPERCKR